MVDSEGCKDRKIRPRMPKCGSRMQIHFPECKEGKEKARKESHGNATMSAMAKFECEGARLQVKKECKKMSRGRLPGRQRVRPRMLRRMPHKAIKEQCVQRTRKECLGMPKK